MTLLIYAYVNLWSLEYVKSSFFILVVLVIIQQMRITINRTYNKYSSDQTLIPNTFHTKSKVIGYFLKVHFARILIHSTTSFWMAIFTGILNFFERTYLLFGFVRPRCLLTFAFISNVVALVYTTTVHIFTDTLFNTLILIWILRAVFFFFGNALPHLIFSECTGFIFFALWFFREVWANNFYGR